MKQKNNLKDLAKGLRRKQTDAEARLWYKICNRQIENAKFRRQQQVEDYIVDFVCFEKKLIIELDGGQHNEPANIVKDNQRTHVLESKGYRVLRYWDNDVLGNTDGVLEQIRVTLTQENHPHPFPAERPSPVEGEE
jgi:very-short-patch-repair endonuclease